MLHNKTLHLLHSYLSEPSENQLDCSNTKKIMSEGHFIHQVVNEVETTWSNYICIAPSS